MIWISNSHTYTHLYNYWATDVVIFDDDSSLRRKSQFESNFVANTLLIIDYRFLQNKLPPPCSEMDHWKSVLPRCQVAEVNVRGHQDSKTAFISL